MQEEGTWNNSEFVFSQWLVNSPPDTWFTPSGRTENWVNENGHRKTNRLTNSLLWKMVIEIVDLPIQNGDFFIAM